jgi:hypothetical protein
MRFLFGLILVAGLVLIAWPRFAGGMGPEAVGTWRVYEARTGFAPASADLTAADAPLAVAVEMTTRGVAALPQGAAILTVTAAVGGRTVLAEALDFVGARGRDTNPQTLEKIFRAEVGTIDPVETGTYIFTVGKGDADGVPLQAVDLVLTRGGAFDRRLQPIGFSLAAIGFIGLVLALRRGAGGPPPNPNSQPPPRRWGRGA